MKPIDEFLQTVETLRSPDGCPWDKEQTHYTLRRYLIEEAYETIDAIEKDDSKEIMEELGDVLLQVVLHSQIAKENKMFNFDDVADFVNKKMISRHPHVFGDENLKTADEVLSKWEDFKKKEKPGRKDIFESIPASLPALLKSWKVSKKAAKVGFNWEKESDLWKTLDSELIEFKDAVKDNSQEDMIEEMGDILFMLVNIARWHKIDPEDSLNKATKKFIKRFKKVEELSTKELKELNASELENLWQEAKKEIKN